jgi:hypothetical protein
MPAVGPSDTNLMRAIGGYTPDIIWVGIRMPVHSPPTCIAPHHSPEADDDELPLVPPPKIKQTIKISTDGCPPVVPPPFPTNLLNSRTPSPPQ